MSDLVDARRMHEGRGRPGLLDYAANALPAASEQRICGWRWRRTDSSMWWTGAAMAHGEGPGSLTQRVRAIERCSAAHGVPPRFQICPDCPPALDAELEHRDYRSHSPMTLRVATAREIPARFPTRSVQVHLDADPDDTWLRIWQAVNAPEGDLEPESRLFHRINRPRGYATALLGHEPVAVGLAVAEDDWAGVFGMATLPPARGRGAGQAVLVALARWALDHDAAHVYVQVEQPNATALRLYGRAGFTRAFDYHYRTRRDEA